MNGVRQFFQKLKTSNLSVEALREKGLQYWRERIYGYILATLLVVGVLALVPSVFLSFIVGYNRLGVFDIVVYLVVVVLFFLHGVNYEIRASLLLLIGLSVGIIVFIITGDEGPGLFWMFVVPPLASLLLGLRLGSYFLVLNAILIVGIGFLISLKSPLFPQLLAFSVATWVVYSLNFLVTNALVTIPLGALLQGLFASTEREKQTEFSRANTATQLSLVYDNVADIIFFLAVESVDSFRFLSVNSAFFKATGLKEVSVVGKLVQDVIPAPAHALVFGKYNEAIREKKTVMWEETSVYPTGTKQGEVSVTPIFDARDRCTHLVGTVHDISERKEADAEIRKLYERYRKLFANMLNGYAFCQMLFDGNNRPIDFIHLEVNGAFEDLTGLKNVVGKKVTDAIPGIKKSNPELLEIYGRVALTGTPERLEVFVVPLKMWLSISVYCPEKEFFIAIFENISERRKMEIDIRASEERYRRIVETADEGIWILNPEDKTSFVNAKMAAMLGCEPEEMLGRSLTDFMDAEGALSVSADLKQRKEGIREQIDRRFRRKDGSYVWAIVSASPIMNPDGQYNGALGMVKDISRRKEAEEKVLGQLGQLQALSEIDRAILSSFDLQLPMKTLLKHAIDQLQIDAGNVMVFDPIMNTLHSVAGYGFRTQRFEQRQIQLGEGYAGKAALENHLVHIANLAKQVDNPRLAAAAAEEGFVGYYAVPLVAKGGIKGVLEVFKRSEVDGDADWQRTLEIFASQAAIAIDAVTAFENLQKSNAELILSYNATIEGWSRALDLRDKETEGHTQRVADLSVKLARSLGMNEEDLVHFRRGALLHDIGKMGIPDTILHKPDKLTEQEWEAIKMHPAYARDMLSPIGYLKRAMDIPYSHHEKWDGSGYPQGLKGEEIPLAARIFAVADVYDALTSDRPYRKAWSKKKTIDYIREQTGKLFDPKAVEAFLKLDLP